MLDKTDGRVIAGDWTEIRVSDLKRMWAEGLSATQIAGELGGLSRSAVLGKVHRLKISHTAPETKRALTANRRPRKPGWRPVQWNTAMTREERLQQRRERALLKLITQPQPLPPPPVPRPDFLYLTFEQIQYGDCRYPVGDGNPFVYCGNPTVKGSSWCLHCYRITHAPMIVRRTA
jgi:GcrA cell cycle regulator